MDKRNRPTPQEVAANTLALRLRVEATLKGVQMIKRRGVTAIIGSTFTATATGYCLHHTAPANPLQGLTAATLWKGSLIGLSTALTVRDG